MKLNAKSMQNRWTGLSPDPVLSELYRSQDGCNSLMWKTVHYVLATHSELVIQFAMTADQLQFTQPC